MYIIVIDIRLTIEIFYSELDLQQCKKTNFETCDSLEDLTFNAILKKCGA